MVHVQACIMSSEKNHIGGLDAAEKLMLNSWYLLELFCFKILDEVLKHWILLA